MVRPSQTGELLLELLGGGRDPSVGHRQEAREHGVGISRHAFKEMRDGFPSVGRKTTGIDLKELVQLAPQILDAIDGPEISALAKRLLLGPEDYDYDYYMGELRCTSAGPLVYPPDRDGAGYTYW